MLHNVFVHYACDKRMGQVCGKFVQTNNNYFESKLTQIIKQGISHHGLDL